MAHNGQGQPRSAGTTPAPGTPPDLARRAAAEGLGTAVLLACVVGSGIMAERLAGGNMAIALLANTIATGAVLLTLILTLGEISGAHLNPAVTLCEAWDGTLARGDVAAYLAAQVAGALAGVVAAHVMFGEPILSISRHQRSGPAQVMSEAVATFGLVVVIRGTARRGSSALVAAAVAAYITAAYWFTASTSFANPAVTVARCLSDTFAGIRPADVPWFIGAQLFGAGVGARTMRWLLLPRT